MSLSRRKDKRNSVSSPRKELEFLQDSARSAQAEIHIAAYIDQLSVNSNHKKPFTEFRDDCLAYLDQQRQSEVYRRLKNDIDCGKEVTASEYYYFALVTSDVSQLDVDALESAEKYSSMDACKDNMAIIKAALHFKKSQTPEDKAHWQQELSCALKKTHPNKCRPLFLNAAGMDIAGADLECGRSGSGIDLSVADLRGAILDGCNLYRLNFVCSDLSGASLKNVTVNGSYEKCGPRFDSTIARGVCLDNIDLTHTYFRDSDLTGASFKGVHYLSRTCLNTKFNGAKFHNASLHFFNPPSNCSFEDAEFLGASMKGMCFHYFNYKGARFIDFTNVHNLVDVQAQLNAITIPDNIWPEELRVFQDLLADDVLRCAVQCFDDVSLQCDAINTAIDHRLFHMQESRAEWLADSAKSIFNSAAGTLFSDCGKFRSGNPSISYLQEQRDAIDAVAYPEWTP